MNKSSFQEKAYQSGCFDYKRGLNVSMPAKYVIITK